MIISNAIQTSRGLNLLSLYICSYFASLQSKDDRVIYRLFNIYALELIHTVAPPYCAPSIQIVNSSCLKTLIF